MDNIYDITDNFSRNASEYDFISLLLNHGWKHSGKLKFSRPGKNGGVSGGLIHVNGTWIFHNFSSNSGLKNENYNYYQLLTELVFNNNYKESFKYICNESRCATPPRYGTSDEARCGTSEQLQFEPAEYLELEEAAGLIGFEENIDYDTAFIKAKSNQRLYNVSVNRKIFDKNCDTEGKFYPDFITATNNFRPEKVYLDKLINIIGTGHAVIFAEMKIDKNGYCIRKSDSFIKSELIAVDIDDGLSIEDAVKHDFIRKSGICLYTSVNHKDDNPRFRIIFQLDKKINSSEAYRKIVTKFINSIKSDNSCKDTCRMFYGNRNTFVFNFISGEYFEFNNGRRIV
jgi:hypothetical protein